MVDAELKPGDVAVDLVERGKVQVVEHLGTVEQVRERDGFDLAGYEANALLEVEPYEPAYKCVYLPENPSTSFSGTYDFPRSRLARVPVEEAAEDVQHPNRQLLVDVLEDMLSAASGAMEPDHVDLVEQIARDAGVPDDLVDEARELHDASQLAANGGECDE